MKFVIVAQSRSGTSMIVNTLNSLPDFNVYGELFVNVYNMLQSKINHPQEIMRKMILRYIRNSYDLSDTDSVKTFLDNFYKKKEKNIGFKLLYTHLKRSNGNNIIDYIQSNDIFKVIVNRENKLKQVISGQTNKKQGKVSINVEQAVKQMKNFIDQQKILENTFANGNFIKVSYEQLTNNKNVNKMDLSLLGFDGIADIPMFKYRPNRISENISNLSELEKALPKEYKEWLD